MHKHTQVYLQRKEGHSFGRQEGTDVKLWCWRRRRHVWQVVVQVVWQVEGRAHTGGHCWRRSTKQRRRPSRASRPGRQV